MSGLEIAGVVLGAIPVATKIFRSIHDTFEEAKDWKVRVTEVRRRLRMLDSNMRATMELVLLETTPRLSEDAISHMMAHPFDPKWRDQSITDKIFASHGDVWKMLISTMDDLCRLMKTLLFQLGLSDRENV